MHIILYQLSCFLDLDTGVSRGTLGLAYNGIPWDIKGYNETNQKDQKETFTAHGCTW